MQELETLYEERFSVFNNLPGLFVLLLPDAPMFTIIAVSNDYLEATLTNRKHIVGKGLFEVFAAGHYNKNAEASQKISASLNHVIRHKAPHFLSEQRFDIYNPLKKEFEYRLWRMESKPVFGIEGEMKYIIHRVEDHTAKVTIDATEQQENIRRIEQSEQEVRAIIDSAPFPIGVYVGKEMRIQYANRTMIDVWGKGPDVIGKTYPEILPELESQEIYNQLDYVFTTGTPFHKRGQRVDLVIDGKLQAFYFNYSFTPLFNSDGSVYGVMNTAAEITDLIVAKHQVEQSERNFRNMILQSPVAICILLGPEHKIDIANDQMIQLWGKTREQVMGKPVFEALPDSRDQGLESLLSDVFQNGVTHRFDQRPVELLRNGQYETTYQNFVYQPYKDGQGNIAGVLAISVEVTQQVKYQQHLKLNEAALQQRVEERTKELENQRNLLNNILVNSSNGISVSEMIRDENRKVIDAATILANDAAIKFTGLPREIYFGRTAKQIDPRILESEYGLTCLKTLESGKPCVIQYFLEYTGRWLELTISKMDDDHLIHIFTDVTPIKEAQLQLERLVKDLKRSNANLEEFAFAASHDMKEPIRKIHFFTNLLKDQLHTKLDERQQTLFQKLENASEAMGNLIDDLLTYSQVNKGATIEESVDLNEVLKAVLVDLELQIHEKNADVSIEQLPVIKGNARQLHQLFQNLLNNAVKYSKEGKEPRINVSSQLVNGKEIRPDLPSQMANRNYYFVTVKDNGIGFEQTDAERIFNVFTRLHGNTEYRGTGVGLSIARKVLENHLGLIWAESEPGMGASFNMLFPVR